MIKPPILIALVLVALTISIPTIGADQPANGQTLQIVKLSTQATNLGNGCFFPITIKVNVTWTDPTSLYSISLNNFWLVIANRNTIIGNTTSARFANPNDAIQVVQLFPNLPVTLQLTFARTCLTSVGNVQLIYLDGTYEYSFSLP